MKKSKILAKRVIPYEQLENKVAFAWTRVSSDGQKTQGSSLASQREEIECYAQANGITIKRWYGEESERGTVKVRKLFDNMIAAARKDNQVNVILCHDANRFGRTGGGTISLKDDLLESGIYVIYTSETNYNRKDAGGYFADSIRDIQGKVDTQYRRKECENGIIRMLNRGEWCFHVPLGYTRTGRHLSNQIAHHEIVINSTGEILRNAWIWRAEGQRIIDIVHKLNALGLRMSNGKPIHEKRLSKILQDPFYAGWIEHPLIDNEEHRIRGLFPALIDDATFKLANGYSNAGYTHQVETSPFPLKRHIYCDSCGGALTGYTRSRKKHTHYYYKCNTIGCRCNCNADEMHVSYRDLLEHYRVKEEFLPIINKMLKDKMKSYCNDAQQNIIALRKCETEVSEKLDNVEYRFAIGEIPESAYIVAKKRLSEEKSKIINDKEEIENQLSNTFPSIDKIMLMCCKLGDLWQNSSFKERQKLQNLAFPNGVRYSRLLGNYRTPSANKVLTLIREISDSYEDDKSKSDSDYPSESPFVEKT